MNVFEDLIVDLKKENLLEETVLDDSVQGLDGSEPTAAIPTPVVERFGEVTDSVTLEPSILPSPAAEDLGPESVDALAETAEPAPAASTRVTRGKEFFKKRAVAEVSSLQMVEHVLTGVEREYLKTIPKTFDDFKAKKALSVFLQAVEAEDQNGHAEAEFALMQETEAWCSALAERDKHVPVSCLRQYCENTRPALNSQAMLAIARFYRNLPFSEAVRAKFDFVITRVFSRHAENERRVSLFGRNEMLNHINTLYSEWASVPLYTADDDSSKVMLTALSFEDLAVEAEHAVSFDQLIKNDFFGRLRLFKESISEIFFAPEVTVAAVEANVRIGNAYVTLIAREKEKMDAQAIANKYADLDHQGVSDALARTLKLVDVLKNAGAAGTAETKDAMSTSGSEVDNSPIAFSLKPAVVKKDEATGLKRVLRPLLALNRWVLAFSVLMITASIVIVIWSNFYAGEEEISTSGVKAMQFSDPHVAEHIKIAKVSGGILYVQLAPSWDVLAKEKREDVLQKLYSAGTEKGYTQVQLVGKGGANAGYASANKLEVEMP